MDDEINSAGPLGYVSNRGTHNHGTANKYGVNHPTYLLQILESRQKLWLLKLGYMYTIRWQWIVLRISKRKFSL